MPIVQGCPADLDATGKARWRMTKAFIESQGGGWHDVYASTLERYVRSWALIDRINSQLAGDGLTAPGSQGQPVPHPLLKTWGDVSRVMESAAKGLRLTPEARKDMGEPKPPTGKFGGAFS